MLLSGASVALNPARPATPARRHEPFQAPLREIRRAGIDQYIAAPAEAPYVPVREPDEEATALGLRAAGITTVIWAIGFAADYRWIEAPLFDGRGCPVRQRGVTGVDGLYFLGLPWQNIWGSGRFADVGRDAEYLLERIAPAQLDRRAAP